MQSLTAELTLANMLAREAGAILLEVRNTQFKVDYKAANDPVTEADRRANALIVHRLHEVFPHDGIIAEESPLREAKQTRCWYVDPLDGTREFVAGRDDFAVMIGLAIEGRAELGVVYQPLTDKLYYGVVGEGAFLEHQGKKSALVVTNIAKPSDLRLIVSRSHRSSKTDKLKERLGITEEIQSGSVGIKIGAVAEGIADLYVHISDKSSVWDTCGPEAILKAAGGLFTDVSGADFVYDGGLETYNRRGIFACNRASFDTVLQKVRAVANETGFLRDSST